jgi:hypothetical protein
MSSSPLQFVNALYTSSSLPRRAPLGSFSNLRLLQPGGEIATDRPDTTNSSLVVPKGSFQQENGVNLSSRDGGQVLDGTNTRLLSGSRHALRS